MTDLKLGAIPLSASYPLLNAGLVSVEPSTRDL